VCVREEKKGETHVAGGAHGDLHGEHGARNNEVEEPLRCSAHGDVQGAESGRRDLTDENPADGAPAELEEDSPGVDQDDGEISEPGDLQRLATASAS